MDGKTLNAIIESVEDGLTLQQACSLHSWNAEDALENYHALAAQYETEEEDE